MSDKDLARRTVPEVIFAGVDISTPISKCFLSMTYTDNEEDETDDLQIRISDRENIWMERWLSEAIESAAGGAGFLISAAFISENRYGDGKDKRLDCGQFQLDCVTAEGPPAVIALKATSLPYGTQIRKTVKNKAWESHYLSKIAKEIASAGGMTCLYESSTDPYYPRLEQLKTSDIKFLSTLCHNAGISLKVTNNIIVLFDQADYESKTPVLDIKYGDGAYIRWSLQSGEADTGYASCRISYVDPAKGLIEGLAYAEDEHYKNNGQRLEVTAKVSDSAEAKTLAAKRLRLANKYGRRAWFELPGNPDFMAGLTVTLTGFGMWSGGYIICQAQHSLSRQGYVTQIALRRALEGY